MKKTFLFASALSLTISSPAYSQINNGLTNTQLRASPVPVSGTVTASGPLTDTQLRASNVGIKYLPNTDNYIYNRIVVTNTPQTLFAAAGASTRNYIGQILLTCNGSSAATSIVIDDGSSAIWSAYYAAGVCNIIIPLQFPLRGPANTALRIFTNDPTVGTVIASVIGYTAP